MQKRILFAIMISSFWSLTSYPTEIVIFQNGKYLEIERHQEKEDQYLFIFKGGGQITCAKSMVMEIRGSIPEQEEKREQAIKVKEIGQDYMKMIDDISGKYGVDPSLVKAIVKVESNFDPKAISSKGAKGIMQLMPETARRFQAKDIFSVRENIEAGIKYLKFLMKKYDGRLDLVLAAYNAGEEAVDQYQGIPPFQETVDYVLKVFDIYKKM